MGSTYLKEKDMLLMETHHRVKNNMNVVAGLLRLQSNNIKDKSFFNIFRECENRIKTMALIHEELCWSKTLSKVDCDEYIRTLSGRVFKSYVIGPDRIILEINISNVSLCAENAVPCGLIINELLSNSIKYAFPENKKGKIKISMYKTENLRGKSKINLVFSDNGIGLSKDLDLENIESLGLGLVHGLTKHQLGGSLELARSKGTEFKITFYA